MGNESEDEPRMDEEVNLLGLSDDALDEDDYNDAVDELDRADESDEQADPSDRRSYLRRYGSCPPGYKRSGFWYLCTRDTKSTTSYYMVLDGKRYRVTPSSGRMSVRLSTRGTMELGGAKYTVTQMRRRRCWGRRCWLRG